MIPFLSAAIMVKNESEYILPTLSSCVKSVDEYIIFDTGSTDNTIEVIKQFCEKNNKRLHILEGTFVDFSTSRNQLLRFADGKATFILLMDSGDELRDTGILRDYLKENPMGGDFFDMMFNIKENQHIKRFYRPTIIRAVSDFIYERKVHEYLTIKKDCKKRYVKSNIIECCIFQDRDIGKPSTDRLKRDVSILLEDLVEPDGLDRTLFYLSQTYVNLNDYEEALKYFKMRIDLGNKRGEKNEEDYIVKYRYAFALEKLKYPVKEVIEAFIDAANEKCHVEPLFQIAHRLLYIDPNAAFDFAMKACQIPYIDHPENIITPEIFEMRWKVLADAAVLIGNYKVFLMSNEIYCDFVRKLVK